MNRFFFKTAALVLNIVLILTTCPGHTLETILTSDNRLTLRADGIYLRQILQNLAGQGIKIRIDPAINFKVNAAYRDKPVQQVLDAILDDNSHVLIWEDGKDGKIRLTEIQIFKPGHKDRMTPLTNPTFKLGRHPETGALFVRHEVLVRVSDKHDVADLKAFLSKAGGTIISRTGNGIYRVQLPVDINEMMYLAKLRNIADIAGAELNYAHRAPAPFRAVHPDINLPEIQNRQPTANQIPVAVFDSGLAPEFQKQAYILDFFNAIDPTAPVDDPLGHGTQMAMLAAGAIDPIGGGDDPNTVPVIAIRGFDDNGITSNFTLMQGVSHAMEAGARVLSLSWHSETESHFLEQVLTEAAAKGLVIVAAAGNEPTGKSVYPAGYESVLGVGALHPSGQKWANSNFGDFVSIQAPGFANMPVGYNSEPGIYAGTSISTAYTANRIADYLTNHPKADIDKIRDYLNAQAEKQ